MTDSHDIEPRIIYAVREMSTDEDDGELVDMLELFESEHGAAQYLLTYLEGDEPDTGEPRRFELRPGPIEPDVQPYLQVWLLGTGPDGADEELQDVWVELKELHP